MITVPAHRVKQFGVEFFQASFSAKDIDRLVKFEVLGYAGAEVPAAPKRAASRARVNWEMLEKRIAGAGPPVRRPQGAPDAGTVRRDQGQATPPQPGAHREPGGPKALP